MGRSRKVQWKEKNKKLGPGEEARPKLFFHLSQEEGAVEFFEGAYVFPLAFLTILFVISMAFLLAFAGVESSRLRMAAGQPTDAKAFSQTEDLDLIKRGRGQGLAEQEGLFLSQMNLTWETSFSRTLPLRFFLGHGQDPMTASLSASWNSTANTIWRLQAVQAWAGGQEGENGP